MDASKHRFLRCEEETLFWLVFLCWRICACDSQINSRMAAPPRVASESQPISPFVSNLKDPELDGDVDDIRLVRYHTTSMTKVLLTRVQRAGVKNQVFAQLRDRIMERT
jgi:hypothetical protein